MSLGNLQVFTTTERAVYIWWAAAARFGSAKKCSRT